MGHAITPSATKALAKPRTSAITERRTNRPDVAVAPQPTLVDLALQIADDAVRSDIECFAHGHADAWGRLSYDISKPNDFDVSTPDDNARAQRVVDNAMRYIGMRGEVFPWRMFHAEGDRNVVRFEAKP